VADKELIGKTIKRKNVEFEVSEEFYGKEPISAGELKQKLSKYANINLIGEKAVAVAIEENLARGKQVKEIAGVKHLQVIVI